MDTKGRAQHPPSAIPASFGTEPTLQIYIPFFPPVNPMANKCCYGNESLERQGGLDINRVFLKKMFWMNRDVESHNTVGLMTTYRFTKKMVYQKDAQICAMDLGFQMCHFLNCHLGF